MGHLIEHIDNENEWHKGRSKGIGGSDVASILGLNPYKSNVDLWKEKTGRSKPEDISNKPYVVYGKQAEKFLRDLFILDYPLYAVDYSPYDLHIHKDFSFVRGSFDGELTEKETQRKGIVELKTSEIKRSQDWKKWEQQIPMNYFCQILHYMAIDEDFKFCKLKAQLKHYDKAGEVTLTTRHYHFERENYLKDIEYLLNKEVEFWHYIEADEEPPLILPPL